MKNDPSAGCHQHRYKDKLKTNGFFFFVVYWPPFHVFHINLDMMECFVKSPHPRPPKKTNKKTLKKITVQLSNPPPHSTQAPPFLPNTFTLLLLDGEKIQTSLSAQFLFCFFLSPPFTQHTHTHTPKQTHRCGKKGAG